MSIAVPTTSGDRATATATTGSTISCNKPANVADGDLLVAFVYYRNSGTTITPPSGWTQQASNTTGQSKFVYTKPIPSAAGETATSYSWSFTGGSAKMGVIIFRVTGANLSAPLDAAGAWESGPTSTMVLPAVTAVATNTMLLEFGLSQTTTTTASVFTAPGTSTTLTQMGWNDGTASADMWVGFESVAASGNTGTRTATLSPNAASGNGIMLTIAPIATTPPTASFTVTSQSGLAISVDGTGSTASSPATITGYDWNWGDGTAHGTGSTASHTYATGGTYTVTLTVTDSNSNTGNTSTSVTVAAATGTVTAQSVDVSTGWTPSSGTALACISDGDPTTFVTSSAPPTGQEFDLTLHAVTPPTSGQPFKVFLVCDAPLSASATWNAQLGETISGSFTQRSALTGVPIAVGSGGTVTGVVALTFPWTDVQNMTTGGWNAPRLKLQATAS